MPIYEYACPQCDHTEEALKHPSSADTPVPCPECGATLKRVPSVPGRPVIR